jgi:outer membrane protein
MKKILLGLALFGSIASADFIGASVGAGLWQENIDGYVKTGNDINYLNNKSAETDGNIHTGNLGLSDEVKPYVWAKIIHPIPLIPNIRAEYRQYKTSGTGVAVGSLKVFGKDIPLSGRVNTTITINSYDVTAFYELKVGFEAEAGVGINVLDGTTEIKQVSSSNPSSSTASWVAPIPYLYARLETPTILGFSLEAQGKYIDVSSAYYHDYQGALKYHFINTILDLSLAVGYKYQDIYGEDGDNTTDLKFEGAYAELGVRW